MNQNYFVNLPKRFTDNILGLHADKGKRWLADLPQIVGKIAENWSLSVEKPFLNLSFNFVAPCICADGSQAVLKIGYRGEDSEIFSEAKLLRLFDGKGTVKLLRFDKNYCALLLERLIPGANLIEICQQNDAAATAIAIDVMRKLWQKKPPEYQNFPRLEKWTNGLQKAENTSFPARFISKARNNFDELFALSKQNFLLHGDLHHENILSAEREPFLAIDPKGIIGDIGYDISVFLNNPLGWVLSQSNPQKFLTSRVEQFAEAFKIEPQNLRKWAFAQMVLSAWWTFEENGKRWETDLTLAGIWEKI